MIYIFDTMIFRIFGNYFPDRFPTLWINLNNSVEKGEVISVKEVLTEINLQNISEHVMNWVSSHKNIFLSPTKDEVKFISEIFEIKHFRQIVGKLQRLQGSPVADPYIIACAKLRNGCVVTEEKMKDNAAKIPNVCNHFSIECIDLENFMERNNWLF